MDKQTLQLKTRDHFAGLRSIIKSAVKAKAAYREQLKKIDAQRGSMYSEEYTAQQRQAAKDAYRATLAAMGEKMDAELAGLQGTLREAHNLLDLGDPRLTNALAIIRNMGAALPGESAAQINNQFASDQAALRLLKNAYKDAGAYDARIDTMIYSANDALMAAGQYSKAAFQNEGSINSLALQLSKIAGREGIEFDANPDPSGLMEAAYRGAGMVIPQGGFSE